MWSWRLGWGGRGRNELSWRYSWYGRGAEVKEKSRWEGCVDWKGKERWCKRGWIGEGVFQKEG